MRRLCMVMLGMAAAAPLAAQRPQGAGAAMAAGNGFVMRLGTDTVAVERVTRGAGRLDGEVAARVPRVVRRLYVLRYGGPDGAAPGAEVTTYAPGSATPLSRVTTRLGPDSIITQIEPAGGSPRTVRLAAPRPVVLLVADAWAPYEYAIRLALAPGPRRGAPRQDSVRLATYQVGAGALGWLDVIRHGRDSVILRDVNFTHRVAVTEAGMLAGALRPAQQFTVARVPTPDMSVLLPAWAERERQQGAVGVLSPRDSLRATVAGATITLEYSRPARRGRTIFGGVVPWNEVWRTGANAATRFTTDRPLALGGVVLPAGTYSLWTIPAPEAWALLINTAADAGGTEHDPARDVFRLPMQVTTLPQPVERLTISVTPESGGGRLRVQWDTVEASIPFVVR